MIVDGHIKCYGLMLAFLSLLMLLFVSSEISSQNIDTTTYTGEFIEDLVVTSDIVDKEENITRTEQIHNNNITIERSTGSSYKKIEHKYLTIHHTAWVQKDIVSAMKDMVVRHQEMVNKGWQKKSVLSGSPIAYHFIVWVDGDIVQNRNIDERSSHHAGANSTSLGIAMIWTFRGYPPTQEQYLAVRDIIEAVEWHYWEHFDEIRGHHERTIQNKAKGTIDGCPGHLVDLDLIRSYSRK